MVSFETSIAHACELGDHKALEYIIRTVRPSLSLVLKERPYLKVAKGDVATMSVLFEKMGLRPSYLAVNYQYPIIEHICATGDFVMAQYLYGKGFNYQYYNYGYNYPIKVAYKCGHYDFIIDLLKSGIIRPQNLEFEGATMIDMLIDNDQEAVLRRLYEECSGIGLSLRYCIDYVRKFPNHFNGCIVWLFDTYSVGFMVGDCSPLEN